VHLGAALFVALALGRGDRTRGSPPALREAMPQVVQPSVWLWNRPPPGSPAHSQGEGEAQAERQGLQQWRVISLQTIDPGDATGRPVARLDRLLPMLFDIFQGRVSREPGALRPIPQDAIRSVLPSPRLGDTSASHPLYRQPRPRLDALRVLYQGVMSCHIDDRAVVRPVWLVKKKPPAQPQTTGATSARRCARRARFRQSFESLATVFRRSERENRETPRRSRQPAGLRFALFVPSTAAATSSRHRRHRTSPERNA